MEVIVNYPTDPEEIKELISDCAKCRAMILSSAIDKMDVDVDSKNRLYKKMVEIAKERHDLYYSKKSKKE